MFTVVFVLIAFAVIAKALSGSDAPTASATPAKTPEQLAETARRDRENTMVFLAVKSLKERMKKPETFEVISATMIDGAAICIQYKARNSWNDVHPATYVITDAVSTGEAKAWNKHCAGKSGDDYTSVRALLP